MTVSAEPEGEWPDLSAEALTRAAASQRRQLSPSIIAEARHYIEVAGLDPDTEPLLLNGYGLLREKGLSMSAGQEKAAHLVNNPCDQKLFAFVLSLYGRRTELDRFTRQFPVIFDVKKTIQK